MGPFWLHLGCIQTQGAEMMRQFFDFFKFYAMRVFTRGPPFFRSLDWVEGVFRWDI